MNLQRIALFALLVLGLYAVAACGAPQGADTATTAPIVPPTATPQPSMSLFIPLGSSVRRDLGTTTEIVRNCVPDGEVPIIKNPSRSIVSSNSIEWTVGGNTGVGGRIGGGVLPIEVNLDASLGATYGRDISQATQVGTGWDLPAKSNTIVTYILQWQEEWQPGYVELRVFGQAVTRIDVLFRLNVTTDIVAEDARPCDDIDEPSSPGAGDAPTAGDTQQQPAGASSVAAPPVQDSSFTLIPCGAFTTGETKTLEAGTFVVGDVIVDNKRQYDGRKQEATVVYLEKPAVIISEYGAACYRGDPGLMSEVVQGEYEHGCDGNCIKARVVYVRANGQQDVTCYYPDGSVQELQSTGTETWCP